LFLIRAIFLFLIFYISKKPILYHKFEITLINKRKLNNIFGD
jgi:hypothetical protein